MKDMLGRLHEDLSSRQVLDNKIQVYGTLETACTSTIFATTSLDHIQCFRQLARMTFPSSTRDSGTFVQALETAGRLYLAVKEVHCKVQQSMGKANNRYVAFFEALPTPRKETGQKRQRND